MNRPVAAFCFAWIAVYNVTSLELGTKLRVTNNDSFLQLLYAQLDIACIQLLVTEK